VKTLKRAENATAST